MIVPLVAGCDVTSESCIDPELLGAGEREMRATLAYVEVSESPAQQCGNCQFFRHDDGACGECEILAGPVSNSGYCSSWAEAKSA